MALRLAARRLPGALIAPRACAATVFAPALHAAPPSSGRSSVHADEPQQQPSRLLSAAAAAAHVQGRRTRPLCSPHVLTAQHDADSRPSPPQQQQAALHICSTWAGSGSGSTGAGGGLPTHVAPAAGVGRSIAYSDEHQHQRLRHGQDRRRSSSSTAASSPPAQAADTNTKPSPPPPPPPLPPSRSLPAKLTERLPGVAAAAGVLGAASVVSAALGTAVLTWQGLDPSGASPISTVPVAILLGGLLNNAVGLPFADRLKPGLAFCQSTVLRAGIVAVGIKLSLVDVAQLGMAGVPIVVGCIATGMVVVPWLGRKLGLNPKLAALTAAGTSICGVTAIVSLAPAIQASKQDIAFAVANVVAFGLAGMLCYPYLAHALLPLSEQVGVFLGTAVHDTAQVLGAAMSYRELFDDDVALKVAIVTKLTRNMFLAAVIPTLAFLHRERGGAPVRGLAALRAAVPTFVGAFVAMAALRTAGDATLASSGAAFGALGAETWTQLTSSIGSSGSFYLLGTAMAAVGLNTSTSVFRGVGYRPFVLGLASALLVSGVGLSSVLLAGDLLASAPPA